MVFVAMILLSFPCPAIVLPAIITPARPSLSSRVLVTILLLAPLRKTTAAEPAAVLVLLLRIVRFCVAPPLVLEPSIT